MIPLGLADAPWLIEPADLDLTRDEQVLLHHILVGRYDGYSTIYSEPGRRKPTAKQMRVLASLGIVTFVGATEGGWDRGMWAARLTCVGANAAARYDGKVRLNGHGEHDLSAGPEAVVLDGHPGCTGGWRPDGTCTVCTRLRPLDLAAYHAYLGTLDREGRDEQVNGPQLYCIEHGYLRQRHVTTKKVCQQPGTVMHDGALYRVTNIEAIEAPNEEGVG